jgi:electron transport complex protein RnfD
MRFSHYSSPHVQSGTSVARLMKRVLYALIPGTLCMIWFFGWGVVINILLAGSSAVGAEALMLRLRDRPVHATLTDNSALLTGVLLALCLPPLAPWWIPVIGALFAIVVAKQLYGGLGYNPFNPAMVGYVVLLISFPFEMTLWPEPNALYLQPMGLLDNLRLTFLGTLPTGLSLDAITMATPLDSVKTQLGLNLTLHEIANSSLFGRYGGKGWEWVNLLFLLGGAWMIHTRTIRWQIPASMLGALFVLGSLFYATNPDIYPSPVFHLFSGATMLGAFFIATDPISASTTPLGGVIYGAGIGIIVYVIRTWGGYPEGVSFAVLLMNMATPTIDYYTQPRVFGQGRD